MPKVLLVDDEPDICWIMAELLKGGGYDVRTAFDFERALSIIESDELDAAVVDIVLPSGGGIEILKHIHSREPYIPVIMITGKPDLSQMPYMVRAGAYDFLLKPIKGDDLISTVSRAVEKKRLVFEKRKLEHELQLHAQQLEALVAERSRELAEAHNFLNTVLDSSTEYAIIAIDTKGLVTLFNRGAELMFGCAADQVLGRRARELVNDEGCGPDDAPFLIRGQQAERTGCYQGEMELGKEDGNSFAASVAITPIREYAGRLLGYLAIIKDLTAERRNEERLRRMRERLAHQERIADLGRMAAQVAHEVKNPLSGLRLYSLHLKGKIADKLDQGEMSIIDKIIGGIDHLFDTVEQVIDFARPISLTRRRLSLNALVEDVLHFLGPQLNGNHIEVQKEMAESGAFANVDEASIRSSLINLLLNSIEAMPDGGVLMIETREVERAVRLDISDTGCGMTSEQVRNVFEPFYTTKSKGLGLGMSYAQKVVKQHGGTIVLMSQTGKGTRVWITLPLD